MARNSTYTLVMAPGQRLEVSAPDVGTAIAVAREALKYLQGTSYHLAIAAAESLEQEQVDDEAWGGHYVLTCLLCGLAHPQSPGKSDLVAMQEHHMEVHGFKAEDLRLALRVNLPGDREHFIWALAPAQAPARLDPTPGRRPSPNWRRREHASRCSAPAAAPCAP